MAEVLHGVSNLPQHITPQFRMECQICVELLQIEEAGGTAISFAADVSCETEVESMMRTVSLPFHYFPPLYSHMDYITI
jgi:hypothetical protein